MWKMERLDFPASCLVKRMSDSIHSANVQHSGYYHWSLMVAVVVVMVVRILLLGCSTTNLEFCSLDVAVVALVEQPVTLPVRQSNLTSMSQAVVVVVVGSFLIADLALKNLALWAVHGN